MATSKLHRDVVLEHNAQPAPPELDGGSETGAFWVAEGAESGAPTRPFFTDSAGESHQLAGGDVSGPDGAADNVIARFDGETGKVIQGGTHAPSYDDSGNVSVNAGMALRLWNPAGTFYVGLVAPALTATYSLTMPTSLPGGTRLLQCDSVGNLSWTSTGLLSQHHDLSGLGDDDHTQYLLANGTRTAAYIKFGANPATTGAVRLSDEDGIYSRNHAGTADLRLMKLSGLGDFLSIGELGLTTVGVMADTAAGLYTEDGRCELADDGLTLGMNVSSIPPSLAASGKFRLQRYHSTLCCATDTARSTVAPAIIGGTEVGAVQEVFGFFPSVPTTPATDVLLSRRPCGGNVPAARVVTVELTFTSSGDSNGCGVEKWLLSIRYSANNTPSTSVSDKVAVRIAQVGYSSNDLLSNVYLFSQSTQLYVAFVPVFAGKDWTIYGHLWVATSD